MTLQTVRNWSSTAFLGTTMKTTEVLWVAADERERMRREMCCRRQGQGVLLRAVATPFHRAVPVVHRMVKAVVKLRVAAVVVAAVAVVVAVVAAVAVVDAVVVVAVVVAVVAVALYRPDALVPRAAPWVRAVLRTPTTGWRTRAPVVSRLLRQTVAVPVRRSFRSVVLCGVGVADVHPRRVPVRLIETLARNHVSGQVRGLRSLAVTLPTKALMRKSWVVVQVWKRARDRNVAHPLEGRVVHRVWWYLVQARLRVIFKRHPHQREAQAEMRRAGSVGLMYRMRQGKRVLSVAQAQLGLQDRCPLRQEEQALDVTGARLRSVGVGRLIGPRARRGAQALKSRAHEPPPRQGPNTSCSSAQPERTMRSLVSVRTSEWR